MRARGVLGSIAVALAVVASGAACGLDVVGSQVSPADGTDGGGQVDASVAPAVDGGGVLEGGSDGGGPGDASDDGGVTSATLTVVVTGTTAASGAIVSSPPGLGCPGTCSISVPVGTSVTLSSNAPPDDSLVSWTGGGCVGRDPSCTVVVDASKTVTVTYAALRQYVHSATRLYTVDGATGVATSVGLFAGGCNGVDMGDIAIDRAGVMWAISFPSGGGSSSLYTVNPATAACSAAIGSLGFRCNSLTASPDPANPASDVLYAGCTTSFYAVSKTTGAATLVGAFGGGWSASGDLVWIPGAGVYGTFQSGTNDRLGKVNPATGVVTIVGDTGQPDLWAVGHRGGKMLAYSTSAFSVALANGTPTTLSASLGFTAYGAASGP